MRLSDLLRDDAALELGDAIRDVSAKKIAAAGIPGAGQSFLSRATHGGDCNPLFRLASVFILMKRLGMGRERALRILGWLREIVDQLWPEDEACLDAALEQDSRLDSEDDHPRFMAARGCRSAKRELLAVKRRQVAQGQSLIIALQRRLAGEA